MASLQVVSGFLLALLCPTLAVLPLYYDVGNWPHGTIDESALHGKVPQVSFDQIRECPHPCGLMPEIKKTGETVNGGIPQLVNITLHFDTMRKTFDYWIPVNDTRWLDFDFEAWTPVWEQLPNNSVYVNKSLDLVRTNHPLWKDEALIEAYAKAAWEKASLELLVSTIAFVRSLRPGMRVIMYGYPRRYYWNGYDSQDGDKLRAQNDRIMPLFCNLDALAPSVYHFYNSIGRPSVADKNKAYVLSNVQEAVRLSKKAAAHCNTGSKKVFVYTWHRYHEGNSKEALQLLSDQDYATYLNHSATAGAHGLLMWGSEGNKSVSDEFTRWYLSNFSRLVSSLSMQIVQSIV